jgi:adenylate kinase family enzyme
MANFSFQKIVVVGTTSSGKSTLAKILSKKTGAECIDLDYLHWEPNWVEAPDDVFRERVEKATRVERWIVAGNYHVTRDIIWKKAQAIIWLDYPFHIVFWRLLTRTIRRVLFKEKLFSDNVEDFWTHAKIWHPDSLFNWLFKTYWRRKREYPQLFALPENAHLKIVHFKNPREAQKWMNELDL